MPNTTPLPSHPAVAEFLEADAKRTPGEWCSGSPVFRCHKDHAHYSKQGKSDCKNALDYWSMSDEVWVNKPLTDHEYRNDIGLIVGMLAEDHGGVKTPEDSAFIAAASKIAPEIRRMVERCAELEAQGGPISSERWTLDELLAELNRWKAVASGRTCVSFESLCYGASSLWHQTHRENFRKIDRKPDQLSRWVLKQERAIHGDFPAQVLSILERQAAELTALRKERGDLREALTKYGSHTNPNCLGWQGGKSYGPCICGLSEALAHTENQETK